MQVRDVMTREVVTVGPDATVRDAAAVLADGGFAALPVVDGDGRLLGIVAEADLLRDRIPRDPRLHLRRDGAGADDLPPTAVGGVMTEQVRTVEAAADVADAARLFVDGRLRSVPVVDDGRLVGIVSRRDLLRTLVRSDDELRDELARRVGEYTGESGWDVTVIEGVATIQRSGEAGAGADADALRALARTVTGVVGVRLDGD